MPEVVVRPVEPVVGGAGGDVVEPEPAAGGPTAQRAEAQAPDWGQGCLLHNYPTTQIWTKNGPSK